ncbi:MAG: FAD-dependent oxidoreductase [Candidatus Moranbacteria bacterium]|nr:FAD-dependent oxidoreductase [Candidatus Moranbacteria bacterium]
MANYILTLKEARDVAVGTRLFVFDKPEGYVFKAGQYVAMMVSKREGIEPDARGFARSLSIASAPCEPELYFAMRQGESTFKRTFWQLAVGDTVTVTKPVGFFVLPPEEDTRPIVFLAGGIGITPVRSILKQAEYEKSNRDLILFYSNRFLEDAAFDEEIRNIALEKFRLVTVLSKSKDACDLGNDERGYICEPLLKKYLGNNIMNCLYYIVGSPQFSSAMEKILIDLGVPKEQRHMDPFTGLRAVDQK